MAEISESEIRQQSINCYNQWAEQWRHQASYHGDRFEMKDLHDFHQSGVGRPALCIANGASFEENIKTIQQYKDHVDIVACDKTLAHCLANGIKPKFLILCDANVSYEKYCEPVKDQLQDTILIANVCANTKWASNGNWKDIYFFINQDCLQSEKEFQAISGCKNTVVAGTNVSNAMIIILTQCDNDAARNFFGYDKIMMIGFDYCWSEKYYSFDHDGGGKINYMRTVFLKNIDDEYCFTSGNLVFSARWLQRYIVTFKVPVVQCSRKSLVEGLKLAELSEAMQYEYNPQDSALIRKLIKLRNKAADKMKAFEQRVQNISNDHIRAFERSL